MPIFGPLSAEFGGAQIINLVLISWMGSSETRSYFNPFWSKCFGSSDWATKSAVILGQILVVMPILPKLVPVCQVGCPTSRSNYNPTRIQTTSDHHISNPWRGNFWPELGYFGPPWITNWGAWFPIFPWTIAFLFWTIVGKTLAIFGPSWAKIGDPKDSALTSRKLLHVQHCASQNVLG